MTLLVYVKSYSMHSNPHFLSYFVYFPDVCGYQLCGDTVSSFVMAEYKIGHFVKRQGPGMIYGVYKPYLPTVLILLVSEKRGTSHVHLL